MKRALILLLCVGGCEQVTRLDEESGEGSSAVPAQVQQRLTQSCAIPGCHVSGSVAPDLSEEGGGAWVTASGAGGPLITFGDVDNSYLVEKMLPSPSTGSQMPLAPGVLAPEDLALIVGWVAGVEFPDDGGETAAADTEDPPTTDGESGSSGGDAEPVSCALEVVDPAATSPVVSGDEAGVIPSSVGAAIERNCGCHFTTDPSDPALYFPYSGGTSLETLEDFTGDYAGANPAYEGQPAWMAVQDRVITQGNMPTAVCETDGGGTITEEDFALFEAWFEQEAPDGASFTPPG